MLLVTEFTTERGETYTVLQLLKRLRRAIIQIDGILFDHQERIETLEIDVEKIKNDIEDIKEQLLNVINRVDIVENKVEIVEETLVTIENNITNIETILNNHDADILELNTLVTNITTDLNDLQDIVDSIPIVSESPLNGYIKIDGVDTPVFVGGGSGGSGGNGAIIADYPQTTVGFSSGETLICEFDMPNYSETISIYGWLQMYANTSNDMVVLIKGYDENNTEYLLETLKARVNSAANYPYNHFQYNVMLFENGYVTAQHTKKSLSSIVFDGSNSSNDELMITPLTDIPKIVKIKMFTYLQYDKSQYILYPFCVYLSKSVNDVDEDGESGENNSTVYRTKLNTLTNDDLNIYKNIWTLPCPPSAIGGNSCFEFDTSYSMSVAEIDKIDFQCTIMGGEMNLGEININSFEEDFIFMKINLIGGIRKINDTEYFTSSDIEVIISNSNTSTTKTSRVLARLNSSRGSTGIVGVDDNIKFNMMFKGGEVEDRNSTMARGMLKSFYDIKELI